MKSTRRIPALVASLLAVVMSAGCRTTPVSGRPALDLVSDRDVVRMSAEAFADMKATLVVSRNRAHNEMLQRVGERLADVVFWEMPLARWEFVIFEKPGEVNAFAMAGGKVGVYSGTFDVIRTDDELAVVLGHEIAHVALRHVHEKLSQKMLVDGGALIVGATIGGGSTLTAAAIRQVYNLGSGVVGLSFDRGKESEADRMGLIYMARAGYDPRAAVEVWMRIDEMTAASVAPPTWLSTHPSHTSRMIEILDRLPEAESIYRDRAAAGQN